MNCIQHKFIGHENMMNHFIIFYILARFQQMIAT